MQLFDHFHFLVQLAFVIILSEIEPLIKIILRLE